MAMCPKTNQPHQDIVYTPDYLVKEIFEHYKPKGTMMDPCKGNGAFYKHMPEGSDYCEIQEGTDFFDYTKKVDWIITNPPWSILRKFTQHAFDIETENVVFLFNFNALMTKARLRDTYESGYGVKEIFAVDTPDSKKHNWPQAGFQLGAVHWKKGYEGPIDLTGKVGGFSLEKE
jgi:hypothetical protein